MERSDRRPPCPIDEHNKASVTYFPFSYQFPSGPGWLFLGAGWLHLLTRSGWLGNVALHIGREAAAGLWELGGVDLEMAGHAAVALDVGWAARRFSRHFPHGQCIPGGESELWAASGRADGWKEYIARYIHFGQRGEAASAAHCRGGLRPFLTLPG